MASGDKSNHIPVLLDEVLKYLLQSEQGTYVDATFGRGGHSRALLARLSPEARVIALDRDPDAVAAAAQLASSDARLECHHARFSELSAVLESAAKGTPITGILMDVGVSSPQLDDAHRGFSFRQTGPLDMRMDPSTGLSAAQWLDQADEADIARVLKEYGEERSARRIAAAIVAARPLTTTTELADLVAATVPTRGKQTKHPATKTFQAIRIQVNQETEELREGLEAAFAALAPGGRLAVISFHSLEDRVVKHRFKAWSQPPPIPRRVPIQHSQLKTAARHIAGPVRAGALELKTNPRARSATLRVIEKVAPDA